MGKKILARSLYSNNEFSGEEENDFCIDISLSSVCFRVLFAFLTLPRSSSAILFPID